VGLQIPARWDKWKLCTEEEGSSLPKIDGSHDFIFAIKSFNPAVNRRLLRTAPFSIASFVLDGIRQTFAANKD
jgi:hypothetical protein